MNLENVEKSVCEILKNDKSGHGFDHILRVRELAKSFAKVEKADVELCELAALLHDVDDYKLFGEAAAKTLPNARKILRENHVDEETSRKVLEIIWTVGYDKYLKGVEPKTQEAKIVNDADLCDALGAQGILRAHLFSVAHGQVFFDQNFAPNNAELSPEKYKTNKSAHTAQHFFDKLLRINAILATRAGRAEGAKRQKIMVEFLRELFREEKAETWANYLEEFLKKEGK